MSSNVVPASNETDAKQAIPLKLGSEFNKIRQEKPLLRQFTHKFFGILFSVVFTLLFSLLLFQQYHAQTMSLINGELVPLKRQVTQFIKLNKYQEIIKQLLSPSPNENIIEYHNGLITLDEQLLQLKNKNFAIYQQWLIVNKKTIETASRLQQSNSKNDQLKQSSIIQLHLIKSSITRIINNKPTQQSRILKSLGNLITESLIRFEQLTINTPLEQFELLRINVENIFIQMTTLDDISKTKAMIDLIQQVDTFENLVLTEQRVLDKWQGFLILAQNYQTKLHVQQQQLSSLLNKPYQIPSTQKNKQGLINDLLQQYNIKFSNKNITVTLFSGSVISFLFFWYLLWLIRQQIKRSTKQSVAVIKAALINDSNEISSTNSTETNEILVELAKISKPQYSDLDFQKLHDTCKNHENTIVQLQEELQQLSKTSDDQQMANDKLFSRNVTKEMQCYAILKNAVVLLIQDNQVNTGENSSQSNISLTKLYDQIELFYFLSYLQSDDTILKLNDINIINSIYAIFLNKQVQYQLNNQELFFSVNRPLQHYAKVDQRLLGQLVTLLIDINFVATPFTQYHLQLQLQNKSTGQQQVQFKFEVKRKGLQVIPDIIKNLISIQTKPNDENPLISAFQLLFTKLYGRNISVQLIDDGYQFTFELPLAFTGESIKTLDNNFALNGVNINLFSSNKLLNKQISDVVTDCSGKIVLFSTMDSFEQYFSVKALTSQQCHLLIVSADNTRAHIHCIEQQLANLPNAMQPKLMFLQTVKLNNNTHGFFSLAEKPFCQENFLAEIKKLFASEHQSNQLLSAEQCQFHSDITSSITVLLAVDNPQQYQIMQRLLNLLGLQVYIVTTEEQQYLEWKTGRYCLLITEFINNIFLNMDSLPMVNVGVFSLVDIITKNEKFSLWYIGLLNKNTILAELTETLSPWLNTETHVSSIKLYQLSAQNNLTIADEIAITEIAFSITQRPENEIVFDFSRYLQHQGSVEIALFMLEEYSQDNHAQLNLLVHAIKAKDINKASDIISRLNINAKILVANDLQLLCAQWSKLLSGNEIPKSLNKVNALLKDTRAALTAIDDYAETI